METKTVGMEMMVRTAGMETELVRIMDGNGGGEDGRDGSGDGEDNRDGSGDGEDNGWKRRW